MKIIYGLNVLDTVADIISSVVRSAESECNHYFSGLNYGGEVTHFITTIIAVDSAIDATQNIKYMKSTNKSGWFKHPLTGEKIKYIGLGLPYMHEQLEGKTEIELRSIFFNDLYKKMDSPDIKIPKGFDYQKFSVDMKKWIENYMNS